MSKNSKSAVNLKPSSTNAERLSELLSSEQQTEPEANMFKVLDTYRKSVDYYNSYGLKSADGPRKNKVEATKPFSAATYKWGYN